MDEVEVVCTVRYVSPEKVATTCQTVVAVRKEEFHA